MPGTQKSTQPTAFINARLVDPEARYDGVGALVADHGAD